MRERTDVVSGHDVGIGELFELSLKTWTSV